LYVKKTAERYGLTGRGYQMSVDELRALEPPFMVFWELNHFLVVEGFAGGLVYLSDPATGRRAVEERAVRDSYTGIAFRFGPGRGYGRGGARPGTWGAIARRMRGARGAVAFVVLAGLAVMACELVAATYGLVFVDQVLVEGRWKWVRPLLAAVGLTAAVRVAAGGGRRGGARRRRAR